MRAKIFFLLFICILVVSLIQCEKEELTVTTSSPEALQFYNEGVELADKFLKNEAIEKFKAAIELDTTFAMAYYYLSRTYESAGNLSMAKTGIQKAKSYSGTTTPLEWVYINAWEKILDNDFSGAIEIYQTKIKDYTDDKHILFVMGKTHRLMKNFPESIDILNRLIKKDPAYAPAYNQLGYTYRDMGDFDKAVEFLQKYAELEPDEPNPFDSLGDLYRSKGDYKKAIENYKKALDVKPDFYTSYRNLGLCYIDIGEYDLAVSTYKSFLEIVTERELKRDVYSDLVQINLALGKYNEALKYANLAIQHSSSSFRRSYGIATKGYIYYLKNNLNAALRNLNVSLTVLPDAIWAHEWKGLVFLRQAKYDQTLAEAANMKTIIEQYGQTAYLSNYNALLGKVAMAQELYDEAILYFKDAMKYDASSNFYPMACAYFRKGDYDNAVNNLRHIFEFNPNHALAHFMLAKTYEQQNKKDFATKEYQKFLQIWGDADKDISEVQRAKYACAIQ